MERKTVNGLFLLFGVLIVGVAFIVSGGLSDMNYDGNSVSLSAEEPLPDLYGCGSWTEGPFCIFCCVLEYQRYLDDCCDNDQCEIGCREESRSWYESCWNGCING